MRSVLLLEPEDLSAQHWQDSLDLLDVVGKLPDVERVAEPERVVRVQRAVFEPAIKVSKALDTNILLYKSNSQLFKVPMF